MPGREHRHAPEEIKRYFDLVEQRKSTVEERLQIFTDHRQQVLEEIEGSSTTWKREGSTI